MSAAKPFDASGGKKFATLKCPICLGVPDKLGVEMVCAPLASHGPAEHEQHEAMVETVSYNYRCPRCQFSMNYAQRLVL